jgi:hypothetical protein
MVAPMVATSNQGGKDAPSEVSFVIDGLKLSLGEEYQTADRLAAKSRQLFAAALGFFTIVQTVAFNSYESGNINDTEDTWLFGLAAFALLALTAAAAAAVRADSLVPSYLISCGRRSLSSVGRTPRTYCRPRRRCERDG